MFVGAIHSCVDEMHCSMPLKDSVQALYCI